MSDSIHRGTPAKRVKIDGFEIDAVIAYEPVIEIDATEHPVEQGASPTDHIREKPVTLTIEGVQSATPLNEAQRAETQEKQAARPREAYDFLAKLVGRLVTIETELRVYSNMTLRRLSAPRDATTGDVLNFSASFSAVAVVENLTIEEPTTISYKPGTKDLGKQSTKPTDEATRKKSVLAKGADSEIGKNILGKLEQVGGRLFDAVGLK